MKITLNEKLFEARKKVDDAEKKSKAPSDKKAKKTNTKIEPEEEEDSDVELPDESPEEDVKVPEKIDRRSDYAKKIMLLLKKSGLVSEITHEKGANSGIETINFTTDNRNFTVKLKNTNLTDENGEVVKSTNKYLFYKIIDKVAKPMSRDYLSTEDFEDFAQGVVSHTENEKLEEPMLMSRLIPEVEKEVDGAAESKESEASEDEPLPELPPTPEEGKPLPKEIVNQPKDEDKKQQGDPELQDLYNDFLELLSSGKNSDKFNIGSKNSDKYTVGFNNKNNPSKKSFVTFYKDNGKYKATYKSGGSIQPGMDMTSGDVTQGSWMEEEGIDSDSSDTLETPNVQKKPEAPKVSVKVSSEPSKEVDNKTRRIAPAAGITNKNPQPTVAKPAASGLSMDDISRGIADVSAASSGSKNPNKATSTIVTDPPNKAASPTVIPTPKAQPQRPETDKEKLAKEFASSLQGKYDKVEISDVIKSEIPAGKKRKENVVYKEKVNVVKDGKKFSVVFSEPNQVQIKDLSTEASAAKANTVAFNGLEDLSKKFNDLASGTAPTNQPVASSSATTPAKPVDRVRGSQGNASSDVPLPVASKQVAKPKIVSAPVEPKPEIQPEKPAASAVSDADVSTKPEEQKAAEPISEPSAPSVNEPAIQPSVQQIPQEEPKSEQPSIEQPKVEPEIAPQGTFKHPDYKDEISGKDPYSTDRVKQNKQKLQNLNDTEFNIVVSKPFSLGKKSQAEDSGELYSRTVNVDAKGNVRYVFNLKFPEANKKLFEAVDKTNLQTTITKIINSFKNLKTKEIAITDFQNAELDGLYVPKNILASVLVTTSKNIAKAPIAQIPLNPSDKQIKDISLNVTQKISEIIANDVSMEDSITKISFITTLSKSDRQPEEDLSGGTDIGRKIKPPQVPAMHEPVTQVQQDPSYKIDPNDTGVQRMAKQLGITPNSASNSTNKGISQNNLDPLYNKALEFIRSENNASISSLQRQFKINYDRAESLIKSMENNGQIEKPDQRGVRKIVPPATNKNSTDSTQGIPESEVYKNKAVFELYDSMSSVVTEGEITTDQISSSQSFKLRDTKYRGLVNNAFYLESSDNLVFNLMPSQEKGFSVVSSPDSAFVFQLMNGKKKYFSAEKGFRVLGKNDKKELVPVSDYKKAGNLFYVVLGRLPVIQEDNFEQEKTEQEANKEKVVDKTSQSIPQQNQGPATAVGKQKAIQPDTSPISTDPTQVAQIPAQQPRKPIAPMQQNVSPNIAPNPNALSELDSMMQFKKAILGHIRKNLPTFSYLYKQKAEVLKNWLKKVDLLPSDDDEEPVVPSPAKPVEPASDPATDSKPSKKGPGKPKGSGKKLTEASKDNNWERPSHKSWQNPDENPLSTRSSNLRKQDYFGPGQNRKLEKDTVMFATKESDIIDGINKVFKGFSDKSLTKPIDLQPYVEKLQNIKFFPIKVIKLENNMFFVKSDSSDKLFVIAPVGILYERVKHFYETPSATKNSRVLKYTNLASVPLDRANVSMSVIENHIKKGKCAVSETTY